MESTPAREMGAGLFILLGFAALFFLATQTTNIESYVTEKGFLVTAKFEDIAGLKVRAPVTMAGVTIGRVEGIDFDPNSLSALVTIKINNTLPIIRLKVNIL